MTQSNPPDNIEELKKIANEMPALPGVYLMKDKDGTIIYIGKANNLRNRVRSYFGKNDGRYQIEFLIRKVKTIEKIITEDDEQAFLLENDLIKKHQPRYNIQLKDDKNYLSIRIDENVKWPKIELVRKIASDGALYFGPYVNGYELKVLLDVIKRVIPLRTCSNTVLYNRQRPCLEYQIKRCIAPCCLPVDEHEYRNMVRHAISIIKGNNDEIVARLEKEMQNASEELRFEEAAAIRDRLDILESFEGKQAHKGESREAFGLYREGSQAVLSVLTVRGGFVADNSNFIFSNIVDNDGELLERAISQYYQNRGLPEEILLPFEIENISVLRRYFKEIKKELVDIQAPKKGLKKREVKLAELNAKQYYLSSIDNDARYNNLSKELAKKFMLTQIPREIECIDISNLQGSNIVGAIVAFYDGQPNKEKYKRYKISEQGKPDDFNSIYEVVYRRLKSGIEDDDLPDLIVIDGGDKQLAKAIQAKEELNAQVDIISLAKIKLDLKTKGSNEEIYKPERVFLKDAKESIVLIDGDSITLFMQKVRDEAHRFVITFHREQRSKRGVESILDSIAGIGPERKRRLLKHFGSVANMLNYDAITIARVGRMSIKLAEKIKSTVKK